MFWKKLETDKPTNVPSPVGRTLVELMQKMPHTSDHWVKLKAVMRPQEGKPDTLDVRVFDEWEAEQKKVKIQNWASLDQHPDLIQYEGWYDTKAKKVEMVVKQQVQETQAKA